MRIRQALLPAKTRRWDLFRCHAFGVHRAAHLEDAFRALQLAKSFAFTITHSSGTGKKLTAETVAAGACWASNKRKSALKLYIPVSDPTKLQGTSPSNMSSRVASRLPLPYMHKITHAL